MVNQNCYNPNLISRTSKVAFFRDNDMLNIFGYSEVKKDLIQSSKPLGQGQWTVGGRLIILSVD
jgi:hypothetical protein